MTCFVKIIEDSVSKSGVRITSFQLRYARFIHSEFLTHRLFSRNSMSSRAIPVSKTIAQVWKEPAGPVHWGANQPGMKAKAQLEGFSLWAAKKVWLWAGRVMCGAAWLMIKAGLHKQVANRLLEPWQYMQTIVTATEWDNFFSLRCHPDAQPEFQELAREMFKAIEESIPVLREMHLPYVSAEERMNFSSEELIKFSVARCARVSYLTHDKKTPDCEKDVELHDALVSSVPIHASPAEHQALAIEGNKWYKNFRGWLQYRSEIEELVESGEIVQRK